VCGLMVVSSKQNAPIDEREVQGNVTRHFPVKKLRYATSVAQLVENQSGLPP
jgi:hypothetical protein